MHFYEGWLVSVKINTHFQCFILQRATEWDANKIKMIINKPNSSFYDLISAELPSGLVSLTLKPKLIHHTMFWGCFPFSPPRGALFKSALKHPHYLQQSFAPCRKGCKGCRVGQKLRLGLRVDLQTLLHAGSTLRAPHKTGDPAAATQTGPKGSRASGTPTSWLWFHCI